jgi:hypothetical protein
MINGVAVLVEGENKSLYEHGREMALLLRHFIDGIRNSDTCQCLDKAHMSRIR